MQAIVALAGRPNTGKTTLFNALTGLRQRVANFAGCTVEKAFGTLTAGSTRAEVVDLPGTFSIVAGSPDEAVALRFLFQAAARPLTVLCVAEASNLEGDLALAAALKACGYPTAALVNMIDEARQNGITINAPALSRELGMPVFLASARHGEGIEALEVYLAGSPERPVEPPLDFSSQPRERLVDLQERAHRQSLEAVNRCVRLPRHRLLPTVARSIRIDRVLFHPAAGPVILAATLLAVFESLFALGGPLRDAIAGLLASGSEALRPLIPSPLLAGLICDGFAAGASAVLTFLPQIAILFALIGLLEQSGYLPRAGAMVDRALRPFGLDGKVFIPFLSSFACAIPGVMAARTIPNEKRRLTAILLSPLMTCSARIPVYTLLISAFVPETWRVLGLHGQTAVMAAMYVFGVATALALAVALKRTPLYDSHPSPVTVLPPYRRPKARELALYVWTRCSHFLVKAGKVIFLVSLALWTLSSFPRSSSDAPASVRIERSALGRLGHAVEPVFRPLGLDWKLSVAVVSSIAAREVFVGTLGTLFALSADAKPSQGLIEALRQAKDERGLPRYGLPTAISLLLFFAVALQCVSTIVIVRRETGSWRWPALQFACFFVLAYALAWTGYHLAAFLA